MTLANRLVHNAHQLFHIEQDAHLEFLDWKMISYEFFYASEVHEALACNICSKVKGLVLEGTIQNIFVLI
jgi:hypothetical protein